MAVGLTENDVKVLQYVRSRQPVHISQIEQSLHDVEAVTYRVKTLATQEYRYSEHFCEALKNSSYLEQEYEKITDEQGLTHINPLGIYTLTDFGRKALQDYESMVKAQRREMWLRNAWIPILVSIAINLVIRALEWLLPLIGEWVANTL